MEEKVELEFENTVYTIYVDPYTAKMLRTDQDQRLKYAIAVKEAMGNNKEVQPIEANVLSAVPQSSVLYNNLAKESIEQKFIWPANMKGSPKDHEATLLLISLREGMSKKFEDKKTVKKKLWEEMSNKIEEAGYVLGPNGGERCRQKFSNLQSRYFQYLAHIKGTGNEHKDPPPYYEEMHSILGQKAKALPKYLVDSENSSDKHIRASCLETENRQQTEEDKENRHRSDDSTAESNETESELERGDKEKQSKKRKFKTANDKIVDLIKKCHEEDQRERREQFNELKQILEVQNNQRERLLEILQKSIV